MSARNDLRDLLVAKAAAVPALAGATVEPWRGDPREYNDDAAFPYVGVRTARVGYGPRTVIGGTHYERTLHYELWVACRDTADATADDQAADLLEALQAALPGALGPDGHRAELEADETQELAEVGTALWIQRYQVSAPV